MSETCTNSYFSASTGSSKAETTSLIALGRASKVKISLLSFNLSSHT